MSFLTNLVNDFTHSSAPLHSDDSPPQQFRPQQYSAGPPQVPPPWVAEWDGRENRYIFLNQETGQRTFEMPQPQYHGGGGYSQQQYGANYGGQEQRDEYEGQMQRVDHSGRNMALAGVAGLVGGAVLMHEGEDVKEHWDRDEERLDDDKDRMKQRFEDVPGDVAGWAGRKTQEVEDIPEDVERKWDNGVQDVEDVPEDMAGWAGREEGRVERFDDGVGEAFEGGRKEERYETERRDDY